MKADTGNQGGGWLPLHGDSVQESFRDFFLRMYRQDLHILMYRQDLHILMYRQDLHTLFPLPGMLFLSLFTQLTPHRAGLHLNVISDTKLGPLL